MVARGARRRATAARTLKVILETGALPDAGRDRGREPRSPSTAGADFIKTSTGKTPVSATPEAAEIMLEAIRGSGRPVGFKASGGIRTLADARASISTSPTHHGRRAGRRPQTFRIGASGLYDALDRRDRGAASPRRRQRLLMPCCRRRSSAASATAARSTPSEIGDFIDGLDRRRGHRGPGRRLRHGGVLPRHVAATSAWR